MRKILNNGFERMQIFETYFSYLLIDEDNLCNKIRFMDWVKNQQINNDYPYGMRIKSLDSYIETKAVGLFKKFYCQKYAYVRFLIGSKKDT